MGQGAGPAALSFPGRDRGGTAAVTVPVGACAARAWARAWWLRLVLRSLRLRDSPAPRLGIPQRRGVWRWDPCHSVGCPEGLVKSPCL